MVAFKRNYKKAYKPKRPQVKRKFVKRSTSVAKVVKSVLARQVERKETPNNPVAYVWSVNNFTVSPAVDLGLTAFGDLPQGVTDGSRLGVRIDVTKAVLNLNATFNPAYLGGGIPQIVTIFIGYTKGSRTTLPGTASLAKLFNDGPTSTGMDNTTLSLMRTVDKNFFTIFKRITFKLGGSTSPTAPLLSNNDFPVFVNKKISLTPLLGKLLYSNDQFNNYNKQLYMWCQYTNIDSSLATYPPILNWYVDGAFTDL